MTGAELRSTVLDVLGLEISPDTAARLERFELLLRERAVPLGLVAATDANRMRERHILDCLRAISAIRPGDGSALDLGSGAGLPGIVVAIARPELSVVLVEPRRARVAFLELAVEQLELPNAAVAGTRIEDLHDPVDLCFARAFAPLPRAWSAALPRLRPGGRLVYFAGTKARRPSLPPGAGSIELLETPLLASSGPLIIMTR